MNKLTGIKLVTFDMDGTLIDDEWAHEQAKTEISKSLGIEGNLELPLFTGKSNRKFWQHILDKFNVKGDVEDLTNRQFQRVLELCMSSNQLASYGIVNTIKELKSRGIKTAITSGSDEGFIDSILDMLGLTEYFDVKVFKELVNEVKPAPDIYLKALEITGIDAAHAVGVEDSNSGCEALHAAGMYCVGYTNRGKNPQTLEKADFKIRTMCELTDLIESGT